MTDFVNTAPPQPADLAPLPGGPALRRRTFLRVAGASAASAALVLAGCGKDEPTPVVPPDPNLIVLQGGDVGLLNYCFLLKQLEVALYQIVVTTYPADFGADDRALFADLRDHEVIHRQTLGTLLGDAFLPALAFNFSSFALGTRAGVLAAAQRLEDLGTGLLAGALPLFDNAGLRQLLTKMLSVEARHAALVRDLAASGSFAGPDVVPPATGLHQALSPTAGNALLAPYIVPIVVSVVNLPVPTV